MLVKKRWIIVAAVALGAALAFAWFTRRPPEPVYRGRTVTAWTRDMNSPDSNARSNATLALRAMGTNGVAWLVQTLEHRDPSLCFWVTHSKPINTPMRRGGDHV